MQSVGELKNVQLPMWEYCIGMDAVDTSWWSLIKYSATK